MPKVFANQINLQNKTLKTSKKILDLDDLITKSAVKAAFGESIDFSIRGNVPETYVLVESFDTEFEVKSIFSHCGFGSGQIELRSGYDGSVLVTRKFDVSSSSAYNIVISDFRFLVGYKLILNVFRNSPITDLHISLHEVDTHLSKTSLLREQIDSDLSMDIRFEENSEDFSLNYNVSDYNVVFEEDSGKQVVRFPYGSKALVYAVGPAIPRGANISFFVWVKRLGAGHAAEGQYVFSNTRRSDVDHCFGLDIRPTTFFLRFWTRDFRPESTTDRLLETSFSVPLNVWTHVGFVVDHDNGYFKIYGNGMEVGQLATVVDQFKQCDLFTFGRYSTADQHYFDGSMSGARLYSRALSDGEVFSLFEDGM